ncbi:MAG: HAMP domain-containing histidine kinase [Candidatus Omnitrophica bacterium]|nr:HAMP domain-containing histidine kinase [Candidatus Omnitrophota bacterium]
MASGQRNLQNILIMGLCLTTIIPFLVVIYLFNYKYAQDTIISLGPVIVGLTLFLVFFGVYILFNITQAVTRVSKRADDIAQGDLTKTVVPAAKNNTEVVSLASSLSSITRQLIANVDEMERRAILLERANQELELLSNKKTEFISIVSHELRSPLINIKQSVSLFTAKELGDVTPEQKQALELVNRNAERLINLIGDLLDLSAIDFGKSNIAKKQEDLKGLITEAIDTIDRWRETKGLELKLKIPDKLPVVHVDRIKIGQVLTNLLSNAIKYTAPGGVITVAVNITTGGKQQFAEIAVSDTGVGIAQEDLDKIFERFTKLKKKTQTGPAYSAGLGLSIVKEIVKLHDGQITVKSREGKGSIFTLSLPI